MNLEQIKTAVTSRTARQVLVAQKHSPRILFAAGVVGVVGATVLACRATLKLQTVLDDHEKHVLYISEEVGTEQISHEDANKQIAKTNVKLVLDICKLYAPAFGIGILGVASLTGSHMILDKRNAGTMAAYAAVDKAYKAYRERVVAEHGVDVDRQFAQGAVDHEVEEKMADGSTKKTVDKVVKGPHIGGSGYAQVFDERSGKFSREPGMNAVVVQMCQQYCNDKLRTQGHLFLNEVYDTLGLPRTPAGSQVGWVLDGGRDHTGDGYVSFGIWEDNDTAEAFIAGKEKYIVIDPNVDGPIWNKI
jgi:hypothetical protein